jgi:hypothetical protein
MSSLLQLHRLCPPVFKFGASAHVGYFVPVGDRLIVWPSACSAVPFGSQCSPLDFTLSNRSLHVRALLLAFRLRVVLIVNFLFVFDQSRWTWKSLPRGAAECLDDSAPLHRRCHCALSRCSQSRDCSGLRRSLSAAGWVLRCLCSLASHCAGCAGRRVQQFGCLH